MKFNDLKVGMVVGEVLFKGDPQTSTYYTIKIINSIKDGRADITVYGYSEDGGEYHSFTGKLPKTGGPKDFGLSRNINDFEDDDKVEFIKAVFESNSRW